MAFMNNVIPIAFETDGIFGTPSGAQFESPRKIISWLEGSWLGYKREYFSTILKEEREGERDVWEEKASGAAA